MKMKITSRIILIVFISLSYTSTSSLQELKIINGNSLYYLGDIGFKILELDNISRLRGYDIIDSNRIFIAITNNTGGDVDTRLNMFNINEKTMNLMWTLGGTGESYFNYNTHNKLIVFNWYNGIHVFSLEDMENATTNKGIKTIKLVDSMESFYPFWVNSSRIGYFVFENHEMFVKYINTNKKM